MSLMKKLQRDSLLRECTQEVQDLHSVFVTWFRGTRPVSDLVLDLEHRLQASFSHVAPNGQFLQGRHVLLGHLEDKYACYQDRIFQIDIYNVQLLWSDVEGKKCLCTYEEWQSWEADDGEPDEEPQQFGRLSTCLLEKIRGRFQWVHVHETWLEAEAPVPNELAGTTTEMPGHAVDEETVMTGPVEAHKLPVPGGSNNHHLRGSNSNNNSLALSMSQHTTSSSSQEPMEDSMNFVGNDLVPTSSMLGSSTGNVHNNAGDYASQQRLLVLMSNQSLSRDQVAQQQTLFTVLNAHRIEYDVIDGADMVMRERRNELFEISRLRGTYPQLFFVDLDTEETTYWGDWDRFEEINDSGLIVQVFGTITGMNMGGPGLLQEHQEGNEEEEDETETEEDDEEDGIDPRTRNALLAGVAAAGTTAAVVHKNNNGYKDNLPESAPMQEAANSAPAWTQNDRAVAVERVATERKEDSLAGVGADEDNGPLFFEAEDEEAATSKQLPAKVEVAELTPKDPAEEAFLEKSAGILVFEEEQVALPPEEEDTGPVPTGSVDMDDSQSPIPQDISPKRHVSPRLEKYAKPLTWENTLVGISIAGFDIGTSQGPIADQAWYEEYGPQFEESAQSFSIPKPRRKIGLPEMVFPTAHVALEGHGVWLSCDVVDALDAWAKCHHHIAIHSRISWQGVNVLKSKDAKLWEDKRKHISDDEKSAAIFHYDWTFSSPFCGKVEGGEWVELDESGMRMDLLTDQSVPILFFDEVCLYEDDLHDNGQVQYTVKLRVMPTCAYILARLWLRVDNVILRVRESRVLVDFFGIKPQIFRDVTWRECLWENLGAHGLPNDVRAWHFSGRETPAWHAQLQKLPAVNPPKESIYKYAVLEYRGNVDGADGARGDEGALVEL